MQHVSRIGPAHNRRPNLLLLPPTTAVRYHRPARGESGTEVGRGWPIWQSLFLSGIYTGGERVRRRFRSPLIRPAVERGRGVGSANWNQLPHTSRIMRQSCHVHCRSTLPRCSIDPMQLPKFSIDLMQCLTAINPCLTAIFVDMSRTPRLGCSGEARARVNSVQSSQAGVPP